MLLCSIDSCVAAIAIGFFAAGRNTRIRLAVMFAVCDCTASFAGASLHDSGAWPGFGGLSLIPLIIPLAFTAVVLTYYFAPRRSFLLWGLPVLLSVDNFASGWFDPSPAAATSLLLGGLLSGVLALAGFTLASYVEARLPQRLVFVSGLILVVLPFAPTF
jgi:putative Mn2+ efflux pump MntP